MKTMPKFVHVAKQPNVTEKKNREINKEKRAEKLPSNVHKEYVVSGLAEKSPGKL